MKRIITLAFATALGAAFGAELYVDRSGANGAYTSINAAIAAAHDYDTIFVRPGIYDNDAAENTEATDVPAIVYVTKPLNILATSDNPGDTHIVGHLDAEAVAGGDERGAGPNAVRCVRFSAAASLGNVPSVLKGFTIRGGGCYTKSTDPDDDCGNPGGVAGRSGQTPNFYVVDCVISNCVGVRGGLVRRGKYVRCRFSDGRSYAGQNLGRGLSLLNCLVTHMTGTAVVLDGSAVVNTTFADMDGIPYYQSNSSVPVYNSVITLCGENRAAATTGRVYDSLIPYPEMAATTERCVDQFSDDVPYPLIAPIAGDFRLRAGTPVCGIGRAEHIATFFADAPDIVEVYKDIGGKSIPRDGSINPGCYQETVEAKTGVFQFGSMSSPTYVKCNGYSGRNSWLYAFGITQHETFTVSVQDGEVSAFSFNIGGYCRYPDMDDTIRVMAPPVGVFATNTMTLVTQEYWVDPTNGVDMAGRGASGAPFKTLQFACDLAAADGKTLIHAAAGVYDEGGLFTGGHTNRVALIGARHTRIKGSGRGKSFIGGKADTASAGASQGMGPAAVRCVLIDADTYGCVQGFTISDGYADYSADNTDSSQFSGGLLWAGSSARSRVLSDCLLVGGRAFRGSLAKGGSLVRCLVRESDGLGGGALRSAICENCVFDDTLYTAAALPGINDVRFVGCTLVSRDYSPVNCGSSALMLDNCIVRAVRAGGTPISGVASLSNVKNTVFWGYTSVSGSDTIVLRDPKFADESVGDYRLRTDSPAILSGFEPLGDQWLQVQTDVNGKPVVVRDGKIVPGAVQDFVEVVSVMTPAVGSFDVTGETVLEIGESVTVTHTADASRLLLGISADGELHAGNSYIYTSVSPYAADGSIKTPVVVTATYSTNWYVNANTGNDGNSGFTPETPWRTLAKLQAMKSVFWSGDVVHAARGDYNDLTVMTTLRCNYISGYELPSRVEVPDGVTLVADEGPDVTFITGESGSGDMGMGTGAVRCASICDGGRLEGFTLRGGSTLNAQTDGDQFCGGGVLASDCNTVDNCGVVYGCVITNCVGRRGGAVYCGRAVNCKVLDCGADLCSAAGYKSWFLGCYIDGCKYNGQLMRNCRFVGNCTFSSNQHKGGGSAVSEITTPIGGVVNCVFLNKLTALRKNAPNHYKGCKFLATGITDGEQRASLGEGCEEFSSAAAFGLDAEGRPLSKTAGTVDCAVDALTATATNLFAGVDVAGTQRIYNGRMDAGCYEYDWRGEYTAALGVTVTKADPQVVETAGGVLVKDGTLLYAFPKNMSGANARYEVPFTVTGTGVLSVSINGEPIGQYTSAAGSQTLEFKNAVVENRMTFAYQPGSADDGGALLSRAGMTPPPGLMMIVY